MKVISQETFDSVVLENIQEFDYTLQDSIDETIKEFDAQGVQLMNIVTTGLTESNDRIIHNILELLSLVEKSLTDDVPCDQLCQCLKDFAIQCKLSLAHRVLATKNKGYSILLQRLIKSKDDADTLGPALLAMANLTDTNSDILTTEGMELMIEMMKNWQGKPGTVMIQDCLIRWCLECCIKHENNRQQLFEFGLPGCLIGIIQIEGINARVSKTCLRSLRAFVLDDDIRVDFSKAHDHARSLVEEHALISVVLGMVKAYPDDSDLVSEILSTLNRLSVRAEYCQQAVDEGVLSIINDILVSFPDSAPLNRQAIHLLRTICGNDSVKDQVMKMCVAQLVIVALDKHQSCAAVSEAACGCISMLALRCPSYAKQLCQLGAGEVVVSAMKIHPSALKVQKLCCMALRNMSCRVAENQVYLTECGAEGAIHDALEKFHTDSSFVDLAKAALRDLGCDVKLDEAWTGTGKEISRD